MAVWQSRHYALSTILLAVLTVCLIAVGSARAANEVEPNNEILEANGPIGAGESVSGENFTGSDEDWYWLQLKGQQQISLSATVQNNGTYYCIGGMEFLLLNDRGQTVTQMEPEFPDPEYKYNLEEELQSSTPAVGEVRYTTPPREGTYYVKVFNEYDGAGCKYSFSIGPSAAYGIAPPKSSIFEVPEPNDLEREAYGLLKGGIAYAGRIDTVNDVEWLAFSGRRGRRLTLTLTSGNCSGFGPVEGEVFNWWNVEESTLVTLDADPDTRDVTTLQALPAKEDYLIKITGSVGCPWQFELSPRASVYLGGKMRRHHHHRHHRHHHRQHHHHRHQ